MPATQGAPPPRSAVRRPGACPSRSVSVRTRVRAAVVLWTAGALVAGTALAGCEYTYDEGWRPAEAPAAPEVTEPGPPADLWRNDPVREAEMEAWLVESQVGTGLQVAHREFGLLRAKEIRTGATAPTGCPGCELCCLPDPGRPGPFGHARFRPRSLRGSEASPGWRHTRRSTASECGSSGWSSSRTCWWERRSGHTHRSF